jgi:hypothetical protein
VGGRLLLVADRRVVVARDRWPGRFREQAGTTRFVRLAPVTLRARDLSYVR